MFKNQMEINFQKAETKQNNVANDISKVHSGIEILNSQSMQTEQRYNRTLGMLVNHLQVYFTIFKHFYYYTEISILML